MRSILLSVLPVDRLSATVHLTIQMQRTVARLVLSSRLSTAADLSRTEPKEAGACPLDCCSEEFGTLPI